MGNALSKITRGRVKRPPIVILYGMEGIGKSTWASMAANPIFLQTEDGLGNIDAAKFPLAKTFDEFMEYLECLCSEEHDYRTVVIDSADWLEPIIYDQVCREWGVKNINNVDKGFGKGYEYAADKWMDIIKMLTYLRDAKGMMVIVIAHSKIKTVSEPGYPSYDKYMLRLQDRASGLLVEWADCVFFAKKKMRISEEGNKAIATPIGRDGGDRVLVTVASPSCTAKCRYAFPEEIPLDYMEFERMLKDATENNEAKNG